jgi:hypothetical protein
MVKFSLTQLKKQLDQKTKQELIKEISTLKENLSSSQRILSGTTR